MQFSKLKLTGFKSFVDPTELLIAPGMTGIVGPNGCGKSNLVEALRWVMGESSAKQMRGGGMDDVIFNGTSTRPRRNLAEVSLTLENDGRDIGNSVGRPILNEAEEVIVARRIEREKGSGYKLNGADIRARDVQLLFADHASGARSPALVSQGRVGAIINAKPADRRKILEDAAGVSGLHSRRHEAELRLKAALGNLQRLEDVTGTIETQLNSLLRQARQARRYNSLNDEVRRLDALRLYIHWIEAVQALNAGEDRLRQAETVLAEATRAQSAAQRLRDDAIGKLPALRAKDAESRSTLTQIQNEREKFELDLGRREERREEESMRATQIAGDLDRESRILRDMEQALLRLSDEKQVLQDTDNQARLIEGAKADVANQQSTVDACQLQLDDVTAQLLAARSRLEAWQQRKSELEREWAGLQVEADEQIRRQSALADLAGDDQANFDQQIESLGDEIVNKTRQVEQVEITLQQLEADRATAEQALDHHRQQRQQALTSLAGAQADQVGILEQAILVADETWEAHRGTARQAQDAFDRLDREIAELVDLLSTVDGEMEPVVSRLRVDAGYEAALAVALGDSLEAPVAVKGQDMPFAWREFDREQAETLLPFSGAICLIDKVQNALPLGHALQAVWLIDDANKADQIQGDLPQGVTLVSQNGGLWRWDGFVIAPGAPSAAARHLERQNRLAACTAARQGMEDEAIAQNAILTGFHQQLEQAKTTLVTFKLGAGIEMQALQDRLDTEEEICQAAVAEIRRKGDECRAQLSVERAAERACADRLEQARTAQAESLSRQGERIAADAALKEQARLLGIRQQQWQEKSTALEDEDHDVDLPSHCEADQVHHRQRLILAREELRSKETALDHMLRDSAAKQDRLIALVDEQESRENRRRDAATHMDELGQRLHQSKAAVEALNDDPDQLADRRRRLLDRVEQATTRRDKDAALLAAAESGFIQLDTAMKQAGDALVMAREDRIRAESGIEQARQTRNQTGARIAEDLQSAPHELWKIAQIDAGTVLEQLDPADVVETALDRARRQRDAIGPVNLRAEVEAEDLKTQMGSLIAEKVDLESAIEKLHEAIDSLNAEGRQRLLAAFEKVDQNFGTLFRRLFGGGRAHLTLVESDDPLNAGLEIMASPPGKKLTTLSLLSGGEQALTATALLFGVFLTNPAPICVLDEVDAPLDDANTERFATLIEEIVKLSSTRFLVVTHNPLTMARMNRLFGVTMTERGVSRMLSVDLEKAEELVDEVA